MEVNGRGVPKILGKSGFSAYLLDFVGVFARKLADYTIILLIMR